MKAVLAPKAQQDLSDIWDYTAKQWGAAQAENYIRGIWRVIQEQLTDFNASQEAGYIRPGYRKALSGSHLIFFKPTAAGITVVRILHQSMDLPRHL